MADPKPNFGNKEKKVENIENSESIAKVLNKYIIEYTGTDETFRDIDHFTMKNNLGELVVGHIRNSFVGEKDITEYSVVCKTENDIQKTGFAEFLKFEGDKPDCTSEELEKRLRDLGIVPK